MIRGIGIDLIEIDRVKEALNRWGNVLEKRILTGAEIETPENAKKRAVFLAGRFAAKEAVFKSLGISPQWQKVLVLPGEEGQPLVSLSQQVQEQAKEKGVNQVLVSISHSRKYAVAQAIATE